MHRITAAFTVAILTAVPAGAQEPASEGQTAPQPTRAKFEVLAGAMPFGCGQGCGAFSGFDVGATGWLFERIGVSARVRGGVRGEQSRWLEPSIRIRGFVGDSGSREVDFGVGRGYFLDDYYHHSYKVETLVGFRPYERVGFKVGGEVHVFRQRDKHPDGSRSLDAGLLFTFLVVVRP